MTGKINQGSGPASYIVELAVIVHVHTVLPRCSGIN